MRSWLNNIFAKRTKKPVETPQIEAEHQTPEKVEEKVEEEPVIEAVKPEKKTIEVSDLSGYYAYKLKKKYVFANFFFWFLLTIIAAATSFTAYLLFTDEGVSYGASSEGDSKAIGRIMQQLGEMKKLIANQQPVTKSEIAQ